MAWKAKMFMFSSQWDPHYKDMSMYGDTCKIYTENAYINKTSL